MRGLCMCVLVHHYGDQHFPGPCPWPQAKDSPFCPDCVNRHPQFAEDPSWTVTMVGAGW